MQDEPLGYWRMGDKDTAEASDETGAFSGDYYGNYALGVGGVFADDGAVLLDGEGASIVVGDVLDFPDSDFFTLEAWICPAALPAETGQFRRIVDKMVLDPKNGYSLELYDDQVLFGRWRDDSSDTAEGPMPQDEKYHHVVGVHSDGMATLYVDTKKVGEVTADEELIDLTTPLVLGSNNAHTNDLAGALDEVAIYGTALSIERIQAHYGAAGGY